ncbi:MAG: DEAD/DEAH box helicase, partial [Planctomycetota bacterium]
MKKELNTEKLRFEDLHLSREMQKAITDMGFEEATPIQLQSIPHILEGKDVIGQAQTGTGKTAAFGIPALEMIDPENRKLQVVILCPTRELAIQVAEELKKLSKYKKGIEILPIYGGQPIDRQIRGLRKGVQIIIGTPGRVMDHMNRNTLKMNSVKIIILDEADEMLDMGFREDIEFILKKIPEQRQTILFSATMPQAILNLTKKYQNNPEFIKMVHKELTVPSIEQIYYEVKERTKPDILSRLIDLYNLKLSLVFCNTNKRVDELV